MTLHYLKIALRNLLKYRLQNFISVLCLAVGIVCFSMVSYFINQQSDDPDKHLPHYEQMAELILQDENGGRCEITEEEARQIKSRVLSGMDLMAFFHGLFETEITFLDQQYNKKIIKGYGGKVDNHIMQYKGLRSIYTSHIPSFLAEKEVILTESFARKVYGDKNPIGWKLMLPLFGKEYYTIRDVIYDSHVKIGKPIQLFVYEEESASSMGCYILLAKGKTVKEVEELLNSVPIYTKERAPLHFSVDRYVERKIHPGAVIAYTFILLIGALVLIAGVINFLKFTIQLFYNRMRELGLRKCLGSSHWGLYQLLFYEIAIMLLVAFIFSVAITEWVVPYIYSSISQEYLSNFIIEMHELIFMQLAITILVFIICCIIAGCVVLRIRYTHIRQNIVGDMGRKKHVFRNLMLGVQLVICIYFVGVSLGIFSLLDMVESMVYCPLSMDEYKNRIEVDASSSPYIYQHWAAIRSDIEQLPEVVSTTCMTSIGYIKYQKKDGVKLRGMCVNADSCYLSFYHIPMRGEKVKLDEENLVYISEGLEKILQKDSVQGMVTLSDKIYRIAGVYKALPGETIAGERGTFFSVYFPNRIFNRYCIEVTPGTSSKVMQEINAICSRHMPELLEISVDTMYKTQREPFGIWDMVRNLILLLSVISLLITILSIYAAISLDTQGRQKEVAIRKINGATPKIIAILFGKLYIILLIVSFTIAMPLVYLTLSLVVGELSIESNIVGIGFQLFGIIVTLVLVTVGNKLYEIIKLNPAEVIKNE